MTYALDQNVSDLAAAFGVDQGAQDDAITAAGQAASAADAKATDAQRALSAPYQPFASRAEAEIATVPSSVEYLRVLSGNQDLGYVQGSTDGALWSGDSKVWIPSGRVLPHHFGEVGTSGGADEAAIFQEALDYCDRSSRTLYVPEAPVRANGSRGFYSFHSPLKLHDAQTVFGDGKQRTEFRWLADCNGLELADALNGTFTTNVNVRGLMLRGRADISTNPTATRAMLLQYPIHSKFQDMWIQDFVDGIQVHAGDLGAAMTTFDDVHIANSKFPNATNLFPRYGINLTGASKKPQGIRWLDNCLCYAELSVLAFDHDGNGTRDTWVIDLSSKRALYRTTGVQVYVTDPVSNMLVRKIHGTDFALYNDTNGAVINPGDPPSGVEQVRVVFNSPPPAGTGNVRFYWSDPSGQVGIRVALGSANSFGGLVGGWDINVSTDDVRNKFSLNYMQIARIGFNIGADGSQTQATVQERTDASVYDALVQRHGSAEGCVLMAGSPPWREVVKASDQTVTGSTYTTLIWGSSDYLQITALNPGTHREARADLDVEITNASALARADFRLDISYDRGTTWTTVQSKRVAGASGSRFSVNLSHIDKTALFPVRGNSVQPHYRVQVGGVTANDTWRVYGGGTAESYLRAREVNP